LDEAELPLLKGVVAVIVFGLTVINICLEAIFFELSVTMKVTNAGFVAIIGVPEITPLVGLSCNPMGSVPPDTDHI
jgi:hypothetical protein